MPKDNWIGHKGPKGRNAFWTRDDMPGLVIIHCGHPTALRPYYCEFEGRPLTAWDIQPSCWPHVERWECQNVAICALRNLASWKYHAEYWYRNTFDKWRLDIDKSAETTACNTA